MKTFGGKIDIQDLIHYRRLFHKSPIAVIPAPYKRGIPHLNTTRFLNADRTYTDIFHAKLIYYATPHHHFRPMEEIVSYFGKRKIVLKEGWEQKVCMGFLYGLMRDGIKIQVPFGIRVPILATACSGTSGVACYPDPGSGGGNTSVDGQVGRQLITEDFSTKRGGTGNQFDDTGTSISVALYTAVGTCPNFRSLYRGIINWDTSAIPDGNTVSAATASLYGTAKANNLGSTPIHFVASNSGNAAALANADYQTMSFTTFGSVAYADYSTTGYNDVTLNASGIANISVTADSKFGTILGWDVDNSFGGSCVNDTVTNIDYSSADTAGTTQDPKLVVTHSGGGGGKTSLFNLMGVGQ